MRERMQYNKDSNILEIDFSHLTINNHEQINQIRAALNELLSPLYHRVYALVNYEEFMVEDELKEAYGVLIKELYDRFSKGTYRYSTNALTRITIKSTSLKQGMSSRTYPSREEALQAIRRNKEEGTSSA